MVKFVNENLFTVKYYSLESNGLCQMKTDWTYLKRTVRRYCG